jgi:uncharacterized protein (DUF302 family)
MSEQAVAGTVRFRSSHPFAVTLERLETVLRDKGIKVFCHIDHSGEAAQAGLAMPPTMLVIFGSPRAGTPLMLDAPSLALDLPLKALIAEDADGVVWVTGNSGEYLRSRHGLAGEAPALAAVGPLLAQVAGSSA